MGRRDDARWAARARPPAGTAHDTRWAGDRRGAVRCAVALLAALQLLDLAAGTAAPARSVLWAALALLLFAVLCPPRVTAGRGWLAARGLLREHRVRTDRLVSVRCVDGVSQRLVLRDAFGGRVELDPATLVANPPLWYRLAEDTRLSVASGSLTRGGAALGRLAERVDRETARAVFEVSGLD
ncbi:hypothetical protein LZP81_16055 [Streptomyces parvulus]|uniref:hypothetical protein n=1 Tax=Streptomyces parvulus TaxID=146923 RepID=UPI001E40E470|nr:hypothetical protein [Streptomyces parvulus]MCC9156346.1 hypothetical protein [Streptomyces parvulus]MCE7688356.1 hypothetical protein [Streptomyces parvulus]